MPKIQSQNPGSSEIQSPLIAGITEALSDISAILDLNTERLTDYQLKAISIDEEPDNLRRIFEAPMGKKLWLSDPAPVIKKNGAVISQSEGGFSIDHLGGSVTFQSMSKPGPSDKITVTCTHIVGTSKTVADMLNEINTATDQANRYLGSFADAYELASTFPSASVDDFAVVISPPGVYIWNGRNWESTKGDTDLSEYATTAQVNNLLKGKEPTIPARGADAGSDNFFWGGRKTWVDLFSKIRSATLTGLTTASNAVVSASDTVLSAIGKLQAQVSQSTARAFISNTGAPTYYTVGEVGQRYINTSNGDEYVCTAAYYGQYTWVPYTRSVNGKTGKEITLAASDVGALPVGGTASNASKLGSHAPAYFATADSVNVFTCTFSYYGWSGSGGQWTQTVSCPGVEASLTTKYSDPWKYNTGVKDTDMELNDAFSLLMEGSLETLNGQVKATIYSEPPTCDIQIYFRRAVI